MTENNFKEIIRRILSADTSSDPDHWSLHNPYWGHCAVVSLLAQDYFNGILLRSSLEKTEYAELRSHFWNKLPDGREIDLTKDQFEDLSYQDLVGEERVRERVLAHPDTLRRYKLLKGRFEQAQPHPLEAD